MKQTSKERASLYASDGDFCRIFRDDMKSLYLLALVLTADREAAEQCFVSGLDDCGARNQVFKEWARAWARRVVIKNAIRSAAAHAEHSNHAMNARALVQAQEGMPAEIASLVSLSALERFAFVMSFCEGYADRDCTLLLGCTREVFVTARTRAMQRISEAATTAREELKGEIMLPQENDSHSALENAVSTRLAASA